MSNSRVKSEAEYDMIRSNQRRQNNESNPFKVTNNANEYFDAITRRHKEEEEYFENPFEPDNNMMQPAMQMQPANNYVSNELPMSTNNNNNFNSIQQSIASNQSTGNIMDDLSNPFETVSVNQGTNPNYNNMSMPSYNNQIPNQMPSQVPNQMQMNNQTQMPNQMQMNNQMQMPNQMQMNNQMPNYNNQDYNTGNIKAMYDELKQKSLQNMQNMANPDPYRDDMNDILNAHQQMAEPDYNFVPDNNNHRTTVNNHYEAPRMPQSHEQLSIAEQANTINDLINGINRGAIGPELQYEGGYAVGPPMVALPQPNDKAIMDDIDKELEAMLSESDLNIDTDKNDFTSENENLIEEIKRAEQNSRGPARPSQQNSNGLNNSNENMDDIEKTLSEISQGSGEAPQSSNPVNNKPTPPVDKNTQPDNAIDQMISELDNDKVKDSINNTSKMNLSDTLSLALDKNEVMQISKEKMLEEDTDNHKKKKSKIDILINVVLLIMIIVVLGLVAKMILG